MASDIVVRLAIQAFDLKGYLQQHGGGPLHKRNPDEWILDCPVCCKEEKLTVNVRRRGWHCWTCQEMGPVDPRTGKKRVLKGGGGIIRLIAWLDQVTTKEALERLLGDTVLRATPIGYLDLELDLVEQGEDPQGEYQDIGAPEGAQQIQHLLPYMERRRISLQDARDFGLLYVPPGPYRYANRLVFPVYQGSKIVYWQARAMWEASEHPPGSRYIKAINPPHKDAGPGRARSDLVLFNLESARHYPRVCITEGPIDAVRVGRDAVASFGKQLHPAQIGQLLKAGVKAVDLLWDGPSPSEPQGAWPEMQAVARQLDGLFEVRLVYLPQGDPGDSTTEMLRHYRMSAQPYMQSHLFRI